MQHPDFQRESDRIDEIRRIIARRIHEKLLEGDSLTTQQADINRSMWEEGASLKDLESISDFMQHIGLLKQNMAWAQMNRQELVRLDRLFLSPCFARMDFKPDGEELEAVYIGIHPLLDDGGATMLIHDWRAPICGMYYDHEAGPASYVCPAGRISGEISLKRQFRVEGGRLALMIDSSLAIHDDILQDILAQNTTGRMKNIVSTIQREQNRVIRAEGARVVAVQGCAGSGKTSIAMHRAAWLLYRNRRHIQADSLLILSPNAVIGDWIANVLPELGEDAIAGRPISDVMAGHLSHPSLRIDSWTQMMESLLGDDAPARSLRAAEIRMKGSRAFSRAWLDRLAGLERLEGLMTDICCEGTVLVPASDLAELFAAGIPGMNLHRRMLRADTRLQEKIRQVEKRLLSEETQRMGEEDPSLSENELRALARVKVKAQLKAAREQITSRFSFDPLRVYREFVSDRTAWAEAAQSAGLTQEEGARVRRATQHRLEAGAAGFHDAAAILLAGLVIGSIEPDGRVRHLLVDEAQDLSPIHWEMLRRLHPTCGVTLLGDENQNLSPVAPATPIREAATILDSEPFFTVLEGSYRSTREIARFAACFAPTAYRAESFGRSGALPAVHVAADEAGMTALVATAAAEAVGGGMRSVAVLVRSAADAERWQAALNASAPALGARAVDEFYAGELSGVLVVPAVMAKGLEFDAALIPLRDRGMYAAPGEAGLFHTLATRALHRLELFSPLEVPVWLDRVPEGYCEIRR